jgi:predicted AAA+ superfamily ATPase
MGRSLGESYKTVQRHLEMLEGAFMIRLLRPWFENLGKRLVRSPKLYVRDSGLLHALLGIERYDALLGHPKLGASWEGFALEQILIRFPGADAWYWATQGGAELDLMLMRGGKRWGFEFKCTDAPSSSKSMHSAIESLGLEHLWVIYPGEREYPLTEHITVLPLRQLNFLDQRMAS